MIEEAATAIGRALAGRRWRGRTEVDISNEIERVLTTATWPSPIPPMIFAREHILSERDRLDFAAIIPPGVLAIEVKIEKATVTNVARQAQRYLANPGVVGLILATTSNRLAAQMPRELQGRPVYALVLQRM